ncbi:transposase [Limosilactobacillus agrestis]|uniref:transposase n=1 Tax=Limosilactobacillus agrestis TaxID=2759748 RepID=UPI0022B24E34|nr:transposase [Limosilactobacillus agrestis]
MISNSGGTRQYSILCSIPGSGRLNSALLLGFVGNLNRFKTYKKLNAFVGIDLNRYQSGQNKKGDSINRRGNTNARLVEFEMIRSMLRNKGRIKNHLVDYYYKLKKPPYYKHDLVALIACANHLNRTIINLVRTNQVYDYNKTSH